MSFIHLFQSMKHVVECNHSRCLSYLTLPSVCFYMEGIWKVLMWCKWKKKKKINSCGMKVKKSFEIPMRFCLTFALGLKCQSWSRRLEVKWGLGQRGQFCYITVFFSLFHLPALTTGNPGPYSNYRTVCQGPPVCRFCPTTPSVSVCTNTNQW